MPDSECKVAFGRVLLTPEYLANPYPRYREMREKVPVYFSQRMKAYVMTRYQGVVAGWGGRRLICGK